jgi:hypothetical protein
MKTACSGLLLFLALLGTGTVLTTERVSAEQKEADIFDERDTRVFKATACTKDKKPVEALYYIMASRSDLAAGTPSPSSQFMKGEVDNNWQQLAARLTLDEIMEERFADTYHALLGEMIPFLQQTVGEKSGVSIAVSEVNSRPMDQAKDQDVPTCRQQ